MTPLIGYWDVPRTGPNEWAAEPVPGTSRVWITCNGVRVDMRTRGFPLPYIGGMKVAEDVLASCRAGERWQRLARTLLGKL